MTNQDVADRFEVVSDFTPHAYLFLFHAEEEILRSRVEIPFVARAKTGGGSRKGVPNKQPRRPRLSRFEAA